MIAKRMERCGVAGWLVVVTLMFGLNAGAQLASNPPNQASSGAQERKDEKKEEKKEGREKRREKAVAEIRSENRIYDRRRDLDFSGCFSRRQDHRV